MVLLAESAEKYGRESQDTFLLRSPALQFAAEQFRRFLQYFWPRTPFLASTVLVTLFFCAFLGLVSAIIGKMRWSLEVK